jgi:indole-3-glycerol phosphate synthase
MVPRDRVLVSESGIFSRDDLRLLNRMHVNAVLVGEALVTAPDVAAKVRELSGQRQAAGETRPQP